MKPNLIEPEAKHFFKTTLKKCITIKNTYYNLLTNITLFCFFLFILLILLWSQYKGKLTLLEKKEKDNQKFKYIINKIQKYKTDKLKAQQDLITGLPRWENEYDILNKKIV
jgi:preprotein translocase subunit SecG